MPELRRQAHLTPCTIVFMEEKVGQHQGSLLMLLLLLIRQATHKCTGEAHTQKGTMPLPLLHSRQATHKRTGSHPAYVEQIANHSLRTDARSDQGLLID